MHQIFFQNILIPFIKAAVPFFITYADVMELVFNSPGTVKFLCKIPFTFSPESPVKNNIDSSFNNLYRFLKKVLLQFFRIIYKLLPSILPILEVPLASLGSGFPHFAVYRGSSHRFALGLKVLQSLTLFM